MKTENDGSIRVLLAEPQPLFRKAISRALENEADLTVVAEAPDSNRVMLEAARLMPDVIVISADLPGCGFETTERLLEAGQARRVIVIGDEENEAALERAVTAGACGYVTKESSLTDLIEATRAVCRGLTMIPPHLLGGLLANLLQARQQKDEVAEKVKQLSRQEHVVLELLAEGHSNNGIADQLTISPATARTHVQRILAKLEVHSRLEAAAYVRRTDALEAIRDAG